MAFSGSQTTRVGGYGIPRQLNGSFAGKTAEVIIEAKGTRGMGSAKHVRRTIKRGR